MYGGALILGDDIKPGHANFLLEVAARRTIAEPARRRTVQRFYRPPGAVTAEKLEDSPELPPDIKRRWYREFLSATRPTRRARRSSRATATPAHRGSGGCPYVEFTAEAAGGLSRAVYDYVNDRLYVSVHHNWVDGYNPFFLVTDLGATR